MRSAVVVLILLFASSAAHAFNCCSHFGEGRVGVGADVIHDKGAAMASFSLYPASLYVWERNYGVALAYPIGQPRGVNAEFGGILWVDFHEGLGDMRREPCTPAGPRHRVPLIADPSGIQRQRIARVTPFGFRQVDGNKPRLAVWMIEATRAEEAGRACRRACPLRPLKRHERIFTGAGIAPNRLENRHVRVRGWVEERNGPRIEATGPEQIEILERN